jgi:hypothetical protein
MWPFKSREPNKPRDPSPNDWSLGQGERDGFPMIVRIANAFAGLAPLPDFDHHILVSVHFRNRKPNGFPSSEEGDDLQNLEVGLCGALEAGNGSLCALVVTNNGLRDFIFYTRNVESARQTIDGCSRLLDGFVVEFTIEPDPNWDIYQAFSRYLGLGGGRNTN